MDSTAPYIEFVLTGEELEFDSEITMEAYANSYRLNTHEPIKLHHVDGEVEYR